jgi:uncharacterized protein
LAAHLTAAPADGTPSTQAAGPQAPRPEFDASFGCALAKTQAQEAICRNDELLKLDQHLSLFYTQAFTRASEPKRKLLYGSRDAFAGWVEKCRSDACIAGIYLARIREVSEIMLRHNQSPTLPPGQQSVGQTAASKTPAADASFSCRLARTDGQAVVCKHQDLLKLDQHLSLFYTQAFTRANASKRQALLRTRDDFVSKRDLCQSDACVRNAYLGRIRQVGEIMAGTQHTTR